MLRLRRLIEKVAPLDETVPGQRFDCSLAHQRRLRDRFTTLLERGGPASIEVTQGAPDLNPERADEQEEPDADRE